MGPVVATVWWPLETSYPPRGGGPADNAGTREASTRDRQYMLGGLRRSLSGYRAGLSCAADADPVKRITDEHSIRTDDCDRWQSRGRPDDDGVRAQFRRPLDLRSRVVRSVRSLPRCR